MSKQRSEEPTAASVEAPHSIPAPGGAVQAARKPKVILELAAPAWLAREARQAGWVIGTVELVQAIPLDALNHVLHRGDVNVREP